MGVKKLGRFVMLIFQVRQNDRSKTFRRQSCTTITVECWDKEKRIDAVTISTPDHIHGPAAKYAMERGIHVYVQKPMTHNIREARLLTEMAREKKIVSQMGNQGGSNPLLGMVQKWVDSDAIGAVFKSAGLDQIARFGLKVVLCLDLMKA